MAHNKNEKIGIVGSGLIGKSWAMIFASEGFSVVLYDVDQAQVNKAIKVNMARHDADDGCDLMSGHPGGAAPV